MILSDKHKFCYYHLQKTAGTTLNAYLIHHVDDTKLVLPTDHMAHHSVSDTLPREDYFHFATVREPLSWYRSMYAFMRERAVAPGERSYIGDPKQMTFDAWLQRALEWKPIIGSIVPKAAWNKKLMWRGEIAEHMSNQQLANIFLDCGWYTVRFLFTLSREWRELFQMDQDSVIERGLDAISMDAIVDIRSLTDVLRLLEENTDLENLPNITGKKNRSSYRDPKLYEVGADTLQLLHKKDRIIYNMYHKLGWEL